MKKLLYSPRTRCLYALGALNVILTICPFGMAADTIAQYMGKTEFDPLSIVLVVGCIILYPWMQKQVSTKAYPKWLYRWFEYAFPIAIAFSTLCVLVQFILHYNGIG